MLDQPIVHFVHQHDGANDCTVAAFAMFAGISYTQALVTIAQVKPTLLTEGVNWHELKRAAKRRGLKLMEIRAFDLGDDSEDVGILAIEDAKGKQHAVFFKRGMIFDGRTGSVWDADVYLRVEGGQATSMLVRSTV